MSVLRNAHEINLATGEGFMLVFKAQQLSSSRLRNCACNEEYEYKDKCVSKINFAVETKKEDSLLKGKENYGVTELINLSSSTNQLNLNY